ncbi:MAG TPA: sulfatase-like hydrolase/transferase [Candidatus Binatia bacterium]|nr:sulfatase-like hydrolase/transferase [Candidatus Binatia bacterium]
MAPKLARTALCAAALAACVVLAAGCDDRGSKRSAEAATPAAADVPPAVATAAGGPWPGAVELARAGRSTDLLCDLAPASDTTDATRATTASATTAAIADAPLACECGRPSPACRVVDVRNDRRRAIAVAPGSALRAKVAPGDASELRFAVAVVGDGPLRIDVRMVVRTGGAATREWRRALQARDRWVDGAIDLGPLAGAEAVDVAFEAASGPAAPPGSLVALAAPRLVRPLDRAPADGRARVSNVVLYMIDTLRADRTSTYGYARDTTPRLSRLAAEGVTFDSAYSVASWTRPAVASLLTGLYPSAHGVDTSTGLAPAATTLAERFRRAGWSTWAFVASLQIYAKGLGFEQGFDRFVAFPGWFAPEARTYEINSELLPQLDAFGDEPFFLYVHAVDPHAPYDPPPGWLGRFGDPAYGGPVRPRKTQHMHLRPMHLAPDDLAFVRDLYDEEVLFQDAMLGVLLDRLAALGLDRSTIVIVVADHGEELFDRGDWEHGARLFEEQIHVPLVVRVPAMGAIGGRRVRSPVQIVDVAPTLERWFGLAGGPPSQGRDLTPLFAGDDDRERAVYCEERRPDLAFDLFALREGSWKLIRLASHGAGSIDLLFDLSADPGERETRSGAEPDRLAAMRSRLEAMRSSMAPTAPLASRPVELDEESRRRLEALGYVVPPAGERPPAPEPAGP